MRDRAQRCRCSRYPEAANSTRSCSVQTARCSLQRAADGTRVWALDIDDLLEIARQNVTRSLSDEECRHYLHVAMLLRGLSVGDRVDAFVGRSVNSPDDEISIQHLTPSCRLELFYRVGYLTGEIE